ncbi:MAG: hypothetical protein ACO3L7_01740, partial [Poseidonia sp.]
MTDGSVNNESPVQLTIRFNCEKMSRNPKDSVQETTGVSTQGSLAFENGHRFVNGCTLAFPGVVTDLHR